MDANASEMHQLTDLLEGGFLGGLQQGTTLGLPLRNLLAQKLVMRLHPQHTSTQTTRERRAIPQPQRRQLFGQFAQAR
jgi:hypothetical protein